MTSIERTANGAESKSHNRRVAVVAGALVLGLLGSGGLVLRGTEAAFTMSTQNADNQWQVGSVVLTNNLGAAMFTTASDGNFIPGKIVEKCIDVIYTGNTAIDVKLIAVNGTAPNETLGTDLKVTVEEGTPASTSAAGSCTSFTKATEIYSGTLANFKAATATTPVGGWSLSTNGHKVYRFNIELPSTATTATGNASATFKWEAKPTP
jgi:hypothetical protein